MMLRYGWRIFLLALFIGSAVPLQAQQGPVVPIEVKGLQGPVNVRRDGRSIPYIEAKNLRELYFAQGYVTASDRLWQMDLARRTARGELAEVLGRLALEEDKRHRNFGFTQVAEATWPTLKPTSRAALEAYAKGVNAYLAALTDTALPPEFKVLGYRPQPWRPTDSLLIGKLFAEALSTTWQGDLETAAFADLKPETKALIFPEYSPLDVLVVGDDKAPANPKSQISNLRPPSDALLAELRSDREGQTLALERIGLTQNLREASNNWVVSGKRTASGKPLLANDPHLRATAPNIWYLAHLAAPGLRVAGVSAPGVPGILLGHNADMAWGATNLGPDVQDVYAETFNDAGEYQTPQGWRKPVIRREEIKVRKDFSGPATDTQIHEVTVTRHGPVVLKKDNLSYALQWTALSPRAGDFEGFFELQTARNWADFTRVLGHYTGPTQNFIYADTRGNIGYYGAGAIPIRKSGDGSVPYDGATDAGEWTGLIPAKELPMSYNPPSGIIVTANSRVAGKSYKHFLTREWFAPVRARRIYDLLTAKPKLTAEDFLAVQGDTASISGQIFARETLKIAQQPGAYIGSAEWQQFLRDLAAWDGKMAADSRIALLVNETRSVFRRRFLDFLLGERAKNYTFWSNDASFVDRVIAERRVEWLPSSVTSYVEWLQRSHADARQNLTKRYGADESKWTWGAANPGVFFHPLAQIPIVGKQFAVDPYPQSGSGFLLASPNVGIFVSMRHVSEPGNWDASRFGLGLGQSGNPASPYWKDQLNSFRQAAPPAFAFTPAAVTQATRSFTQLVPAPK
jgi:penicillin amidase